MKNLKERIEQLAGPFDKKSHTLTTPEINYLEKFSKDGLIYERIEYRVDEEFVPAFLIYPNEIETPVPGILALHQTTEPQSIGSAEVAGIEGNKNYFYGKELADRGYVVLAPDYPFFGNYKTSKKKIYEHFNYESITMKGIMNHVSAIDILQSLPTVSNNKIGCIGHSLGGTNTMFISFFDKRIKVAAISAGITTFLAYASTPPHVDLSKWAQDDKYMPNTASKFKNDPLLMPFDLSEVLASLHPLPLYISTPKNDEIFDYAGALECISIAKNEYSKKELLMHEAPSTGHDFPAFNRKNAYDFINQNLKEKCQN